MSMFTEYEHGKWYDASELPEPQHNGSIYFITKAGHKYAGTYKSYSIFLSIHEEQFHKRDVDKWIIRDRKTEPTERYNLTYKGRKIEVIAKQDIGFHWRASFQDRDKEMHVNSESKQSAIDSIKEIIDNIEN